MLYKISQFIGRLFFKLYFRLRVEGLENIPRDGACIVVANHVSFLDPLLICAIVPRFIHYLMYATYYYFWPLHWYCKRVHCIPVKKDGKDISALKQALRVLKKGELIGIFPEGERSFTGELKEPEPGTALIALKARVLILPVGIRGAYEAFPRGSKFPRPHQITMTFGKPFSLEESLDLGTRKLTDTVQQQAMDLIMGKIAEVCSDTRAIPQLDMKSEEIP